MSPREIRISADSQQLFRDAATEFARIANEAVKQRGRFTVAFSGRSTPRTLYLPWQPISDPKFLGDKAYSFGEMEGHVAPDNPESNYRMAYESLLSKVPVPPQNIYRVAAEDPDASVAAEALRKDPAPSLYACAWRIPSLRSHFARYGS